MPSLPNIDPELVRRAKQNDEYAIGDIVRKEEKTAYTIAYNFFGRRPEYQEKSKEITQNAFIKAFRNISSLQDEDRFAPWFYTILNNACIDYTRSKDYKQTQAETQYEGLNDDDFRDNFEDTIIDDSSEFRPEEVSNLSAIKEGLAECLKQLPDNQRISLLMYYFEGHSIESIAKTLGQSSSTIKSNLFRGRKGIEAIIEKLRSQDKSFYTVLPIPALLWFLEQEVAKAAPALDTKVITSKVIVTVQAAEVVPKAAEIKSQQPPRIPETAKKSASRQAQRSGIRNVTNTTVGSAASKGGFLASSVLKIALVGALSVGVFGVSIAFAAHIVRDGQSETTGSAKSEEYKEGIYEMKEDIPVYNSMSRDDPSGRTAFIKDSRHSFKLTKFEVKDDGSVWAKVHGYRYSDGTYVTPTEYAGEKYICVKDDNGEYLTYTGDQPTTTYSDYQTDTEFIDACGSDYVVMEELGGATADDGVSYNATLLFCNFYSGCYY